MQTPLFLDIEQVMRLHASMIERYGGTDGTARSPVPLEWAEWEGGWRVLEALYGPDEFVFVGDDRSVGRVGDSIRPAGEWVESIRRAGAVNWPKVMPNPLTGRAAKKKSGDGETMRGDGCVAAHRFAVVEALPG